MKQKRIFSLMTAAVLLLSALAFPAQAAAKPEWVYKFTLWVADVKDAGAPESSVYGYLVFRDGSKREQSFAKAGIKRSAKVTKEVKSGYAPWTVKTAGITNKSDNALCVAYIKLEVKKDGQADSAYITLMDKYNPKTDKKKWIETQKGSGYDKKIEKSVSSDTKRKISAIGNFKDEFSGEYILDVTKAYTNKITKTWNKQLTDQYLTKYNSADYSDAPTVSYAVSGTALDKTLTVNRKLLEKNGFAETDSNDGYTLDMAKILSFMNEKIINKLTVTATLQIPTASLDTDYAEYTKLGGGDDGKFESVYTITRNAFAVSDITYSGAAAGAENLQDNYYYSNANPTVRVSAKVKTGGNNNHITLEDIKGKNVSFKSAKIQLGSDGKALVSASSTTALIGNDGTFALEFPLKPGLDSKNEGLTLLLEDGKIDIKGGLRLCEEKVQFVPGSLSAYASEYKADTITPVVTLTASNGGEKNGWRKSITLTSNASEHIYSNSGASTYEYEFKSENKALSISEKNGAGTFYIWQKAPAAAGSSTTVTVALEDKLEAIGSLVIHGKDIAGNPLETVYSDIKLDNLAPRTKITAKENARAADGSKSIEYSFTIEDASGTGRVYYCFTEGLSGAPVFDENSLQKNSGTLDTTVGSWAYVEQDTSAAALLKCESGKSFAGGLYYFTKDAFDNTSEIQKYDVTLLNENTSCDITAANENTKIPLKDYNIGINTAQGNEIFWRWSYPGKDGYVADYKKYSADIGNGKQLDDSGNEVVLDGACTLNVKIVTPGGEENTVSRQFVFDNSAPEIDFTAKSAGTFREVQTVSVKATDPSQITSASAVVLNADGSEIEDAAEIFVNIADGIAAQNISPTGLKSGTYRLKVKAADGNGYETEKISNPFYIRNGAPNLTLDTASGKTFNGAPLLSNESYTLSLNVNEAFAYPAENILQTLYYRIDGGAWINAGIMKISENGYSLKADIDSPVSLTEGENKISVQTVIAAENANPDYLGADVTATESITVYYDETPPQYRLSLTDVHTSGLIFGTVFLSDNLSGKITLTSPDEKVKLTETADENTFAIEVTGNTETNLTAVDIAGNETKIPVKITMIDKEAPSAEITNITEIKKGARTDVTAEISVNGVDKDTVQFALIPVSEISGNVIDEEHFSYTADAFHYELLHEKNSAYIGETDCVYNVGLAGVSGEYVIGVRCSDSVGNSENTIFKDKPLKPIDAEIARTGFAVSPEKAGAKAVVTVDFNVPVSVLPQNMITDTPAEESTVDETNLELAGNYIEGFSQKTSFVIEKTGTYKLYAVDELGRGKAVDLNVTNDDVSFGNTARLNVNTVLVKRHFDYDKGEEIVARKTPLETGKWASPEEAYLADSIDTIVTRVEITAADSGVFLQDINYMENDGEQPTVDGLTFNEKATKTANAPGADAYTTLVYDVSQIKDENTGKAIDKNERVIEVYAYQAGTGFETWDKTQVIVDTVDNTAPSGEITLEPPVLRDENTGDPLSFTLENVKAQATFSDPHSGISEIALEVFGGDADGYYPVLLTEDYSTEPYTVTNEYFKMTVWSDTNPKSTKLAELEFYQNINAVLVAANTAGSFGYCGTADGLNIDYINKVNISDSDYTLSYFYMDSSGEWQPAADENIYYKNAKAVISPTESGTERGLQTANNGGSFEKSLNSLDRSFDFVLRDKFGYEKTVSASLSHFDETPGTIEYAIAAVGKTNQPVPITITALDNESGVGTVTLTRAAEQIPLTDNGDGTFGGKVISAGNHVITLLDKAGNKTQKSFTVSDIDSEKPVITAKEYSTEQRTAKTVSVKLHFSKPNVRLTKVETDGILKKTDYSADYANSTLRLSENGTLSVWFTDDYGNVGSDTVAVGNIYKIPPAVEAAMAVSDDKLSVNVSFKKAADSTGAPIDKKRKLSELTVIYGGIANRIETENGEKAVYSFSENGIYTFKVYDDEGLASYVTLEIKDIDTTAPKITQIRWSYEYDILENGEWKRKTENGARDTGDEAGYVMATDIYPVTNQNVSITAVTDSKTAVIGADGEMSAEHTLSYTQNGMYIFNLKKANGLSDSYGVDVELIDKTPPVIEVSSPEIVFYENPSANEVPYSKALLEAAEAYDMFGGYKDLSERVTIDYGNFNADDITQNIFDRTSPYTAVYRVSDDAGNVTELKRTVRLVGYFDTVALVNGAFPDYAGRKEINADTINISLENFSGISYAKIAKGVKTLGQMKKIGEVIPEKTPGSGEYEYTAMENGWYTVMVQTDKRDYFNLQIYVQRGV